MIVCRNLNGKLSSVSDRFPSENQKPEWGNVEASLVRPIDLNSDGQIDICLLQDRGLNCWINSEGRFQEMWAGPASWPLNDPLTSGTLRFGDINNDGYVDACRLGGDYYQCVLGSESGFKLDPKDEVKGPTWPRGRFVGGGGQGWDYTWSSPEHYQTISLADIDGDGADDLCARDREGIICYLARNNAFDLTTPVRGPAWANPTPKADAPTDQPEKPQAETLWTRAEHYGTISFPDLDGDGLADICARDKDGIVCFSNVGGKFDLVTPILGPRWSGITPPAVPDAVVPSAPQDWAVEARWRSIVFTDIDGDGRRDVCGRTAQGYECHAYRYSGFAVKAVAGPKLADNYNGKFADREYYGAVRFVDLGGEGRPSVCARTDKGIECWRNQSVFGDQLEQVHERTGGKTNIAYEPASRVGSRIPVSVPVVREILRSADGDGPVGRTIYAYAKGYFHVLTRDFRGFGMVEVQEISGQTLIRRRRTTFSQATAVRAGQAEDPVVASAPMRGRVLVSDVSDPKGASREITRFEYDLSRVGDSYAISTSSTRSSSCIGSKCTDRTRSEYAVDPFTGNLREERIYGDLSTDDDDISKEYRYASRVDGSETNKLAEVVVNRGIGVRQLQRRTRYGFDEQHQCEKQWLFVSGQAPAQVVSRGLVTSVWDVGVDGATSFALTGFDEYGNAICAYTSRTGLVRTEFDATTRSYATSSKNELGHETRTAFAGINAEDVDGAFGQPLRSISPSGLETLYRYDALGRLVAFGFAGRASTKIEYLDVGDAAKQSLRITSPGGTFRRSFFDGLGRHWKTSRSNIALDEEVVETKGYDGLGRIVTGETFIAAGTPLRSKIEYDYRDRKTAEISATGAKTKHCYFDRRQVTVSPSGRRIDRVLDGLGRVVEIIEYAGTAADCVAAGGLSRYSTRLRHDALYGLVKVSDSARVIDLSFDGLGRRTAVSDSMLGKWQYAYNARGLIASTTSPDGAIGIFDYDVIGRVVKKTYVSANKAAKVARLRYDGYREGVGKLTSIIDETGASTFMYDAVGKQVATLRTIGTETYVTHQNYDDDGNITQRIYSDGAALKFVNTNGFLTLVADVAGAALIEFKDFDTLGRPLWMRYRNGVETRFSPAGFDPAWCKDPDLYMCGIDAAAGATSMFKARRVLDTERNVARMWDDVQGEIRLQYESSRLRTATIGVKSHVFVYDDRENIVPGSPSVSYQPNSQLLATVFGIPVTHDNVKRVQRIATSSSGNHRIFDYDSRGSLRRLTEANGTTTDLEFNELGDLVALNAVGVPIHLPDAGTACSDGRCQHTVFLAGAPALLIGGGGKSITYIHTDFHGSVRAITNEKGQLLARYAYNPYGGRLVISEAATWKNARPLLTRGYLGAIELPASGYLLLGQRTYDSRLGRFHQPDNFNPGIRLLRRSNPYAYSNNNPYTYADATGQFPVLAVVLIGGAIFGAVDAQRRDQNILEGALRGAFIAGLGYYVGLGASSLAKAWGINAYFSAAVGQGLYSGALNTSQGGDFGTAFGRGAVMGLVSAGIGRGTMEVIPTPETESFAGAFARQVGRDAIRGAASSVVVGAIYRDDNLQEAAMRGAMYSAGYNAVQNLALLGGAYMVSDGPGRWMAHSFVFRTSVLSKDINAMQLGFATLMRGNIYDQLQGVMPICVVGNPEVEKSWLILDHEHSHVWQYNSLGANFLPAYGISVMFEGYGKSSFEQGGAEFGRPGAPGTHDIPD